MFRVIKKQGKIVEAYRLGEESRMIRHLMEEGKIIEKGSGIFEVFSQEAVHGSGESLTPEILSRWMHRGCPIRIPEDFS